MGLTEELNPLLTIYVKLRFARKIVLLQDVKLHECSLWSVTTYLMLYGATSD
jgi:hypothetical protein